MKYNLYVGGYGTESIARVALRDGRMRVYETFPAVNASYLCLSPDGRRLYAVGETKRFRGEEGGSVQSYDILPGGGLTQTSMQPTHGVDPCHLSLAGDLLIVSNYGSGSLSRYRLEEDGRIGAMLSLVRHEGSGPRPDRQAGPHVHQAQLTPSGWLAVSDLGLDSVFFYPAPEIAQDRPAAVRVRVPAGFGPRHCAFPRGMDVWYVLCELQSELLIYRGAPERAALIGRVPVGDGRTPNAPAALRLSPDQKAAGCDGARAERDRAVRHSGKRDARPADRGLQPRRLSARCAVHARWEVSRLRQPEGRQPDGLRRRGWPVGVLRFRARGVAGVRAVRAANRGVRRDAAVVRAAARQSLYGDARREV